MPELINEQNESEGTGGQVYARIVSDLREALSADEIASIVGIHARQVQNWASGKNRPQGANRDLLLEVDYLVRRLRGVYRPEGVEIWLHGRNRSLNGERPIDLLRAGQFPRVLEAVDRLYEGTA